MPTPAAFRWILVSRDGAFLAGRKAESDADARTAGTAAFTATGRKHGTLRILRNDIVTTEIKLRG